MAEEVLGDGGGDGVELLGADAGCGRRWSSPARSAPGWPARPRLTSRVMVCMFFTRALPPRRPKDTKPSRQGQISRVTPTLAPERLPLLPVFGERPAWPMEAIITASWAETSTIWGRPEASAVSAATAASGPVCAQAVGSVQRTGARSGSPVQYMFPVEAITPRSLAFHRDRGPSRPKGVTWTHTAPGARAGSTSRAPGQPGVASTMSAPASSSSRRGSSGPSTSTRDLPAFQTTSAATCRRGRGAPPGAGGRRRAVRP